LRIVRLKLTCSAIALVAVPKRQRTGAVQNLAELREFHGGPPVSNFHQLLYSTHLSTNPSSIIHYSFPPNLLVAWLKASYLSI